MEEQRANGRRFIMLLLKIVVTIACLWYVSTKINFTEVGEALRKTNFLYIIPAVIAFILSKVVSAIRLNIYFKDISIQLPTLQNIRLYWLGMFYNLFLPGSISGDAYKVIVLSKNYDLPYKKATSAVLLDRVSGLLGLGLILSVFSVFVLPGLLYPMLLIAGAVIAVVGTYVVISRWLKDFVGSFVSTLLWGLVVQALQVICILLVMKGLAIEVKQMDYLFLFLVSSVVAIFPLSIGGLGIREIVFLEGSKFLMLAEAQAVMISLLFYLITLLTSAYGMIYVFRDPLKKDSAL